MALSATLAEAGHPPAKIHTTAKVHFGPVPGGFAISRIDLATEGSVPGTEKTSSLIDLGTGKRVRVDANVDADALGRVLDVLNCRRFRFRAA
jgi:hypothetical protein